MARIDGEAILRQRKKVLTERFEITSFQPDGEVVVCAHKYVEHSKKITARTRLTQARITAEAVLISATR